LLVPPNAAALFEPGWNIVPSQDRDVPPATNSATPEAAVKTSAPADFTVGTDTVPLGVKRVVVVRKVEDAWLRFNCACIVVEAENVVLPEKKLLFARRVEEAAVKVPVMTGVNRTLFADMIILCPKVAPWRDWVEVENEMAVPVVVA